MIYLNLFCVAITSGMAGWLFARDAAKWLIWFNVFAAVLNAWCVLN
jgi:hypothetical protein